MSLMGHIQRGLVSTILHSLKMKLPRASRWTMPRALWLPRALTPATACEQYTRHCHRTPHPGRECLGQPDRGGTVLDLGVNTDPPHSRLQKWVATQATKVRILV